MNVLYVIGLILVLIFSAYKINFLIRYLKGEENTNLIHTFKAFLGWPVATALCGTLSATVYFCGIPFYYIQVIDLLFTMVIISVIDVKDKIIPNLLTLFLLLSQIAIIALFVYEYPDILNALFSAIVLIVLIIISRVSNEQIGMGDVKLITVVNLIYGLSFVLYSTIFALVLMLLFSVPLLFVKKLKLKSQIPFAPFYTLGILIYIILNLL